MTLDELKSPGYVSNGVVLRKEAFRAIGYAANQLDMNPSSTTGADLKAFFLDCAARCAVKAPPKKETK